MPEHYSLLFTLAVILILFQYNFVPFESLLYDLRIKYDWISRPSDKIVIITIDEESDQFLGELYPYTYASHVRLVRKLISTRPAVIGYLNSFDKPQDKNDEQKLSEFRKILERAITDGIQIGIGVSFDGRPEKRNSRMFSNSVFMGSAKIYDDFGNFANDQIVRKLLIDKSGEDSLILWAVNGLRRRLSLDQIDKSFLKGHFYLREEEATMSYFRYPSVPLEGKGAYQEIPFHQVMIGNFSEDFFRNKIVLIGPQYVTKNTDYVWTPFDRGEERAPQILVLGAQIDALMGGHTVVQVSRIISNLFALIIGVVLSLIIARVNPTRGTVLTLIILGGVLLLGHLFFIIWGIWLYLSHVLVTIFVAYYIGVPFRAIFEYQSRFKMIEEAKLLKKVEGLKQNFISLMSHDLKTPVAKIAASVENLKRIIKPTPIEVERGLAYIIDSTKELNNFITTILDLAKLEAQEVRLNKISKDINPLIKSIAGSWEADARSNNVRINLDLDPLYPIAIDVDLFRRVISNLLENAVKYSGKGSEIKIKTWDNDLWVYIEIKDNGVGIEQEQLSHIFDKFYRVRNDTNLAIKGSGLGLYLVKYFVELHGGSITVTSELGKGTSFLLQFSNTSK